MDINWIAVGWILDMIFNGIVWLIIVACLIPLIEVNDKWIRKAVSFMDVACLLYTSPSPRDYPGSRMPSSA